MTPQKGLTILGDLLEEDLTWLAKNGSVSQLYPGDELIKDGQEIDRLFIVTKGNMSVVVDGREVAEAVTGDILGEMSFVEKCETSAEVVARTTSRALAVPRSALLTEFETNTAFAARFYKALAVFLSDRLRATNPGNARGPIDVDGMDHRADYGDKMPRLIELLESGAAAA
ncbi:MAG: cyclic nucleotide-binding domain-containing protein [Pseudomonadota bacterium]